MRIRPAVVEDASALAEIVVAGWRWAYQGVISTEELDALDVGNRMRRFRDRFDSEIIFLVAVDDRETPIGFAVESWPTQLPEFDAEIGGLYVMPTHTRGGVGKALVAETVGKFRARGARTMGIHTLQKNRIGRQFYESIGGLAFLEDEWRGYPAVWYAWHDLACFGTAEDERSIE
jgi:GNAT superfamily N-acetyltransferase